jgi:hypothetical protein
MSSTPVTGVPGVANAAPKLEKKPVKFSNLLRESSSNVLSVHAC